MKKFTKINENENIENYTHIIISLKDLDDRIEKLMKESEILKNNDLYAYSLSKMAGLLVELRETSEKISR